jgi:hypothetical protein
MENDRNTSNPTIEDYFKPYIEDSKKFVELGNIISTYQEVLDKYRLEVKLVKREV